MEMFVILDEEKNAELAGKDFIIYDTLMLQLEAHKINDTVSFIFSVRVPKLHILNSKETKQRLGDVEKC
jgi:ribosomal protein L23